MEKIIHTSVKKVNRKPPRDLAVFSLTITCSFGNGDLVDFPECC